MVWLYFSLLCLTKSSRNPSSASTRLLFTPLPGAAFPAREHTDKIRDVYDGVGSLIVIVGYRAAHHLPATAARTASADAPHLDHLVQLGGAQWLVPSEVPRQGRAPVFAADGTAGESGRDRRGVLIRHGRAPCFQAHT